MRTRTQILVRGTVQGVGFRPFIYSLATRSFLKGTVLNNSHGVFIDVEGEAASIGRFVTDIKLKPPPLSTVESVELTLLEYSSQYQDFRIIDSESNGHSRMPVAADVGTCDDCLLELFDPLNRRFRYPFINCTNCGPRFTIVESVPYDRKRTTMRSFDMCTACTAEYENPFDRRFHAEPIACAQCGPSLRLSEPTADGESALPRNNAVTDVRPQAPAAAGDTDLIRSTLQLLQNGKIIAIKGLGGYHLACDALNKTAVERLRSRKHREERPFALMASSVPVVERYCVVSAAEKELLLSPAKPIVLLERRDVMQLPDAVAPGTKTLGFMLPYTPLHYLLFEDLDHPLVMTSGNVSDEPIAFRDEDAGKRLDQIADRYLTHDRQIHIRTDDSVVRVVKNPSPNICGPDLYLLRRSRGFAPAPIKASFKFKTQILACGAELKNTFCMTRGDHAYVSHHIGDLENLETLRSFTDGVEHYKRLFDLCPEIIAHDLHPDYLSTKYAQSYEHSVTKIGVQHHHAHIASCMADNAVEGEVIGVALDGLGFGTDGKLWGGEFFIADFTKAARIAHLDYIPLPGGAKAIREPWRIAAVYLQKAFGDEFTTLELPFVEGMNKSEWSTLRSMIRTKTNCPETSSMGRLFDAVSALIGVRSRVVYEGQAAIELEAAADADVSGYYGFGVAEDGTINAEAVIKRAVEDLLDGRSVGEVAARFHNSIARLIVCVARRSRELYGLNRVALSGGVFQNMILLRQTRRLLEEDKFEVLIHRRVPTNDAGISFGQAAVANAQLD